MSTITVDIKGTEEGFEFRHNAVNPLPRIGETISCGGDEYKVHDVVHKRTNGPTLHLEVKIIVI